MFTNAGFPTFNTEYTHKFQFLHIGLFLFPGQKRKQAFLFLRRLQAVSKLGHALIVGFTVEDNYNVSFIRQLTVSLSCNFQEEMDPFSSHLLAIVNISVF